MKKSQPDAVVSGWLFESKHPTPSSCPPVSVPGRTDPFQVSELPWPCALTLIVPVGIAASALESAPNIHNTATSAAISIHARRTLDTAEFKSPVLFRLVVWRNNARRGLS